MFVFDSMAHGLLGRCHRAVPGNPKLIDGPRAGEELSLESGLRMLGQMTSLTTSGLGHLPGTLTSEEAGDPHAALPGNPHTVPQSP